jgi:hypothetical protein
MLKLANNIPCSKIKEIGTQSGIHLCNVSNDKMITRIKEKSNK